MTLATTQTFEVERANLKRWHWASAPLPTLTRGQVLVRVERFALTANNVTYGVLGGRLSYWEFFPASAPEWGRIPAWGVAEVIASEHPELPVGECIFGYVPMGSHAVLQPGTVRKAHFAEGSPHRAALNPAYNHYLRLSADPAYDRTQDNHLSLLRPLVMTALVIDAFFTETKAFGAESIVLASASSKTALATAFLLSRAASGRPEVIGLTSPGNVDLCQWAGVYDRVLTYAEVSTLPTGVRTAFLDMSGSAAVRAAIHGRLRDDLTYSSQVGWTHWDQGDSGAALPGITPTFFSSLEHIRKRNQEWGAAAFEARFQAAWQAFLPATAGWLRIVHGQGTAALEQAYDALLAGRARPDDGQVLSV